mgnify:CR=1 FL=1
MYKLFKTVKMTEIEQSIAEIFNFYDWCPHSNRWNFLALRRLSVVLNLQLAA